MTGVSYVGTQWRQVKISPGAQTEDRSTEAYPRTARSGSKVTQLSGNDRPRTAKVGVSMNTPLLALPVSAPIPDVVKKKRVLLVDTSHAKRDLRAEVLRRLGMYVDIAADIAEARSWWRPALYDLVLINMEKGRGQRDKFSDDLRSAVPVQRLAFLVGQPEYLVDFPNGDQELLMERGDEQAALIAKVALSADPGDSTQRWGILEASRRISAVRSKSVARTNAIRALPPPPRDPEGRPLKPTPTSLDDLLREEL
jgi:CheY-like chemotaxis protein